MIAQVAKAASPAGMKGMVPQHVSTWRVVQLSPAKVLHVPPGLAETPARDLSLGMTAHPHRKAAAKDTIKLVTALARPLHSENHALQPGLLTGTARLHVQLISQLCQESSSMQGSNSREQPNTCTCQQRVQRKAHSPVPARFYLVRDKSRLQLTNLVSHA